MIVISGALVLVALVLLIIGVVGPDLSFVYASIVVSLVSLVFLVVGILQRRGETAPAADAAPSSPTPVPAAAEGLAAVVPARSGAARAAAQASPAAESAVAEPAIGGTVLVVEGRPRYHVEACRYLSGKATRGVDVAAAREEGFSPCGVCKPDEALAARASSVAAGPTTEDVALDEIVAEEPVEVVDAPARRGRTAAGSRKVATKAPAKVATKATVKTPAKAATKATVKTPAKAATKATAKTAAKAAAKVVPAKAAAKTPARTARSTAKVAAPAAPTAPTTAGRAVKAPTAAAAAAASTPAVSAAAKRPGSVVVIPDRDKFHRPDCRFVRDVAGAESMSRTAAGRSGYTACGVCKP